MMAQLLLTSIQFNTRSWRNWQTRYFEGVVFTRRVGSSPTDRTIGYLRAGSPTIIESRGRGGMADALASGASDGNIVEVQVLSTAPFMRLWRNWQTRYFEGVVFTRRVGSSPTNRTILKK